jgi:hypothetical protein
MGVSKENAASSFKVESTTVNRFRNVFTPVVSVMYSPRGGRRYPCAGHRAWLLSSAPQRLPLLSTGCNDEQRLRLALSDVANWAFVSMGLWLPSRSWGSPAGGGSEQRQVKPPDDGGDSGEGVGMAVGNMAAGSPWRSRSGGVRWESSRRCFQRLRRYRRWTGGGGGGVRRCWRETSHRYQPTRNR